MVGAWICSILPTVLCLLATIVLIWPGFGVTWFGAGGDPNASLAFLGFSHQWLQYELSQIIPLAVIIVIVIVIGVAFYLLGTKTRQQTAAEPVSPDYITGAEADPAP
jgi:TRAP-type C4-dicarboxylate transport system permease small subunit